MHIKNFVVQGGLYESKNFTYCTPIPCDHSANSRNMENTNQ